ncbi:MAG: PEP/pyruvate-binding domain-containing protein, partial [Myxococcota bacterium]|nr:PEP/pyruvate-binding domain-containing protein [Myxococcota bacterium]
MQEEIGQPPRVLWIREIRDESVGGKAEGLARLVGLRLKVPEAFVVVGASPGDLPTDLFERYRRLGSGRVAVRSSALGEDGEESSFAGQYATFLNVEGEAALAAAVSECLASIEAAGAVAYSRERNEGEESAMSVVVQAMVEPAVAGVLFSADPVSGRHDRLVIDAVAGLGEKLVSGESTPDHYVLGASNELVRRDIVSEQALLGDDQLAALAQEARRVAVELGGPVDMEFAIDGAGEIHWLQARPITTLGTDLNEGYTPIAATDVITRCNVGEMMPGPVCPLTFSTQGRAIENGMQHMHVCYAGRPKITEEWTQINLFYGHMFINLSGGAKAGRHVSITSAESIAQAMCGREIPELEEPSEKRNLPRRWWGSLEFVRYCLKARRVIREFESRFRHFETPHRDDSLEMVEEMETHFRWLLEADEVHLRSSAYSGLMEGVVQGIVVGRTPGPNPGAQQAEAARLLAGATGVESAVMVEQLDAIIDAIAQDTQRGESFRRADPEEALAGLQAESSGEAGKAFRTFLTRHGHRGYRELCVREKAWGDDPIPLIRTMQASIAARLSGTYRPKAVEELDWSQLTGALRFLLPRAHFAIRQREHTKSMLVAATHRLKRGYRHLGTLLEREAKLPEADLVFFLSREELSDFVRRPSPEAVALMRARRRALEFQE